MSEPKEFKWSKEDEFCLEFDHDWKQIDGFWQCICCGDVGNVCDCEEANKNWDKYHDENNNRIEKNKKVIEYE